LIDGFRVHIIISLFSVCLCSQAQFADSSDYMKNIFPSDTSKNFQHESIDMNYFFDKEKSDIFYDSLLKKANRRNWSKELHSLIIRSASAEKATEEKGENRADKFKQYQKKTIRKIIIRQLDVFGPTILDTTGKPRHWVERTLNSLHIPTNHRVIENNLLIDEGERIDPFIIADNERILRNIPSLQDVRIYLLPIDGNSDYVDVLILTKDVMAFGFSWEIFDVSYGQAALWNSNMLGLGHTMKYTAFYNLNREPKYGYNINYKINNLSNTFTSLELSHTNRRELKSSNVQLSRNFISPAIRFGGGFGYGNVRKLFNLETIDTTFPDIVSDYEYYDAWGGYSYPLFISPASRLRKAFFITGRSQIYNFYDRPEVSENFLHDFYQRTTLLASFGLTWQGYHTTNLVYGFGDTEDLPFGAMIKFTVGEERNEFHRRQYYSTTLAYSKCVSKIGYFSSTFEIGGYYKSKIEQGAVRYNFLYLTPLLGTYRHQFRHFFEANYVQGINRFDDEFTIVENENGLQGINNRLLKGDKRLFLNNEFVYYSPHYLYGFRFVYYAFADAAIINHSKGALFDNPMYLSAGIGLRLRNERLVFNTIQLQFNFFPLSPGLTNSDTEFINFTSYPQYRMPEFANRRPEIIEF
jgi:hypothetical protein